MKKIRIILFIALCAAVFMSCSDDELSSNSIFDTSNTAPFDRDAYTYKLDSFLYVNYLQTYNLQFLYRMSDVGADMTYNLVPATYENSKKMAVLTKYLWFDVYDKIVAPDFLKKYGPRIIHLIGSPAYNPSSGTELLGLAEGGIKVSLFKVNELNPTDPERMNEYFFKTMHHEFSHILHQTHSIPKEFNMISYKDYNPFGWQNRHENITFSLGFVSPYGGSQMREDWVEIIANYIVKTDAWWENALAIADKGWIQKDKDRPESGVDDTEDGSPVKDSDGVDGKAVILRKIEMTRDWMLNEWNVDLDALRNEVQYRQSHINMDSLMHQLD
jgi:substrate import-associated zinc metallohydrolase lipoprotein